MKWENVSHLTKRRGVELCDEKGRCDETFPREKVSGGFL
ncbi:hypothetical protein PU02_0295 [Bartonella ancashensis]|uniref:Uncharacterized protein n=1 Tax=Bartonella ancashensis TaxID=1318743 RepID=A0A0M4LS02_9HYPH|nr:hypothetical protein PU02_0295 [Bartonella ancashensis]